MFRKGLFAALLVLLLLPLAGCFPSGEEETEPTATLAPLTAPIFTDYETLTAMYDIVELETTIDELVEELGPCETLTAEGGEEYYQWVEDGIGVAVSMRLDRTIVAKVLYYDDLRQLQGLSGSAELSNAILIKENTDFGQAQALMGSEGVEIAQVITEDAAGRQTRLRLFMWVNPDGSHLDIEVDQNGRVLSCKSYLVAGG